MSIKRVELYGFKCYGEETVLEPVHPNLTVIVGEPGCGKTSIFHGLEYLLSDSFTHLRDIKKSSENAVVEVALDKSKLQICFQGDDGNEVVLSRLVDATSDRYYVNNKRETQYDVQCVITLAGLSSSMHYNILKAGKINELLMASASQRLRLMLNITGMDKIEKQIQINKNDLKENQDNMQKVMTAKSVASYKLEALETRKAKLRTYELLRKEKQILEVLLNKNKSEYFKRILQLEEAADEEEEEEEEVVDQEPTDTNKEKLLVLYRKYAEMRCEEIRRTVALEKRNTLQRGLQIPPELEQEDDYKDPMWALKEKGEEIERRLAELEKESDEAEPQETEPDEVELMRLDNQKTIRKELEEREKQISKVEKKLQRTEVRYQSAVDQVKENLTLLIKMKREHEPKERELLVRAAELKERSSLLGIEIKKLHRKKTKASRKIKQLLTKASQRDQQTLVPDTAAKSGENASRGLVIDAVQCDDRLNVAVQATAGERLFYHVAADDNARRELLSHNESGGKVGVVAMPHVKAEVLDTNENPDTFPLIERLQFAEEDEVLMCSVFGKTLVCRDMDVAVMMSDSRDTDVDDMMSKDACDTVTLEGDMVFKSGLMLSASGSEAQSAMKIYKDLKSLKSDLRAVEKEAKDVKEELDDLKLETRKCCALENDIAKMRSSSIQLKCEVKKLIEQLACLKMWRDTIIRKYLHEDTKKARRREHLDAKEARRNEKKKLIRSNCEILNQRLILIQDPSRRERLVNQKVREKLREFMESVESTEIEAIAPEVGMDEKLSDAKEAITQALAQEKAAEEQNVHIQEIKKRSEQRMQDRKKRFIKKMMFTKKFEECEAACYPVVQQNEEMTPIQAMEALIEVNVALNQQSFGVDKPIDYKEELKEVQMFDEEIREQKKVAIHLSYFIKQLESRQFDCFTRILEQISAKFTEFFSMLVPHGRANLVMLNKEGQAIPPEDMRDLKGIRIEVSLNIDTTPVQDVGQLSRQEREPVAVALKLAFIKCTGAPFYLFDGLDKMLNSAECRQALGHIIAALSMQRQSIVIAYTPEVVRHGNQFFMVRQENQVSHVVPISKEEALQFVSPHGR